MNLDAKIEAILFYRAEPVSLQELTKITSSSEEEIKAALVNLENRLANTGLCLINLNNHWELGTAPQASDLIEQMAKDELSRELGKAALETLTLIVYQGPISRPEIDQVRGVNSSFILRNLMIRGLVERITDAKDSRRFLYQATNELLHYLGLTKIEDLPEYELVQQELIKFFKQNTEDNESLNDQN